MQQPVTVAPHTSRSTVVLMLGISLILFNLFLTPAWRDVALSIIGKGAKSK